MPDFWKMLTDFIDILVKSGNFREKNTKNPGNPPKSLKSPFPQKQRFSWNSSGIPSQEILKAKVMIARVID